jgi:hypothetical protein
MARMTRTIISVPAETKKWLEGYGKRGKISAAEVVRLAIEAFRQAGAEGPRVREERGVYGPPASPQITDIGELRKRAIEAAGRFASGVPDLSVGHDRYLAEEPVADGPGRDKEGGR